MQLLRRWMRPAVRKCPWNRPVINRSPSSGTFSGLRMLTASEVLSTRLVCRLYVALSLLQFLKIGILQSSVAMRFGYGEILALPQIQWISRWHCVLYKLNLLTYFNDSFIVKLPGSLSMKKFWKSIKNCQEYQLRLLYQIFFWGGDAVYDLVVLLSCHSQWNVGHRSLLSI